MKWKWILRLGGLFALLVVISLGVFFVYQYLETTRQKQALRALVQQLDATDPGWKLQDIEANHNAKLAHDSENFSSLAIGIQKTLPLAYKDYVKAIGDKSLPDMELEDHRLPRNEEFCSLHELQPDILPSIQALMQASQLPRGGMPIHYNWTNVTATLLLNVQEVRELAFALRLYLLHQAYFDNGDEALRACHVILKLGEVGLADHPSAISQLVRVAMLAISSGHTQQTLAWTTGDKELEPLQKAYLAAANPKNLVAGLRGERAMYHHLINQVRQGLVPLSQVMDPNNKLSTLNQKLESWKMGSRLVLEQAFMLEVFTMQIEAAKLSGLARQAAFAQANTYLNSKPDMILAKMHCNWSNKACETDDRIQAQLRTAAVGIACERFRLANGRWPVMLTEIPKSILTEIPLDPYTDKPLLYSKLADGVVIYTTGPDGNDDGGKNLSFQAGIGPRDIGFRLYNLKDRRRPPLPRIDVDLEELADLP
jgi:hypothetical protein